MVGKGRCNLSGLKFANIKLGIHTKDRYLRMQLTKPRAYWVDSVSAPDFSVLQEDKTDAKADVVIVGAGIVGLTTAALLKQAGRRVIVMEARKAGAQVTGGSTAKVTSQHSLIYDYLIKTFGEDRARLYAESNQAAIERVEEFGQTLGFDCDFERRPAYLYTQDAAKVSQIEAEVTAATRVGLPASFVSDPPLPFSVAGAIRFAHQAQFHPYKYLLGLAQFVHGDGSMIFEGARVLNVQGQNPCRVITEHGTITGQDVVIATNLPILDRGGFFIRAYPRRHLVLAAKIAPEKIPDGMFLSVDNPSRSIRGYNQGEASLLIAAGDGFKPGADTLAQYQDLERFARERLGVSEIQCWWGNQDYDSMDRLPYVGPLTPASKHLYTATGFNAWGLTLGTVAALILSDRIQGKANPWTSLYDATRFNARAGGGRFLKTNVQVATTWLKDHVSTSSQKSVETLAPDEGALVQHNGHTVAAYRDEGGELHLLSSICPHLRCKVAWNAAERSWDCPCHGSRFDVHGKILQGPAVTELERKP